MTIDVVIVAERWDLYLAVRLMVAMTFQGLDELLPRCVKDVIENCTIGMGDIDGVEFNIESLGIRFDTVRNEVFTVR